MRVALALALFAGIARGAAPVPTGLALHPGGTPLAQKKAIAADKLRVYCRACHGVGTMRFLHDGETDQELFGYLSRERAPKSGKLWADAIVDALSWPTDEPPPLDAEDAYMPQGIKRLKLAQDRVGGVPARRIILEALAHP